MNDWQDFSFFVDVETGQSIEMIEQQLKLVVGLINTSTILAPVQLIIILGSSIDLNIAYFTFVHSLQVLPGPNPDTYTRGLKVILQRKVLTHKISFLSCYPTMGHTGRSTSYDVVRMWCQGLFRPQVP